MRVVLIGAGGIGAPAALALAEAGVRALTVVDDDIVELTNLHRQILFDEADVGEPKLKAFAAAMHARFEDLDLELVEARAVPETVVDLMTRGDVVVDATDNFATRFLLADAAFLANRPIVHAAAVRWEATVMAVGPAGGPCYRCLFEDIPRGPTVNCETAGVMGPICGVSGALAADRAVRLLADDATATGHIVTFDGRADRLRAVSVAARPDCPLCSKEARIGAIDASRYMGAACAVP